MKQTRTKVAFDPEVFLSRAGVGRSLGEYPKNKIITSQGETARAVYYIQKGIVKLAVTSTDGKAAVVAMLGAGDFFGEACLTTQTHCAVTAIAVVPSSILKIDKQHMKRILRKECEFSNFFIRHVLARNMRLEADLVDHLFNSSEKRLARILLSLAEFSRDRPSRFAIPQVSQETLAQMVGTTLARVNHFMNKFRRLGFIHYNGGLQVHSSLLGVVLHD